jgi:apolipoprotein N-acyltransferase
LFIFIAIGFLVYGNIKSDQFNTIKSNSHNYIVRAVSPNIKLNRFYSDKNEKKTINELISLSNPVADEPTIFVWPEGIISDFYSNDFKIYEDLFSKNFSENHLIILGINSFESKNDKDLYFNSLAVFDNHLNLIDLYKKVKLVPFGEFLPFEFFLNKIGLNKITQGHGSFSAGKVHKNITLGNVNILPLICYEIIFPELSQKVRNKNNLVVNISEDGWFGDSIGPQQHFAKAIFRAIENDSFLVRSANKGISAIITNKGEIIKKLNTNETGSIEMNIPLVKSEYKNKNDLIFFTLLFTYLIIFLIFKKK